MSTKKTAISTLAYISISPFKLRRVANVIRGLDINRAGYLLKALPHRGSEVFDKLLKSAVANAVNNHGMDQTKLVVSKVTVDEGPRTKRFQPRARGRIYQIIKRTSHALVEVSES
jgi:large subunit ribosomal protein L22